MDTLSDDDDLGGDLAAIRPAQDDAHAHILEAAVRSALVGATGDPFRLGRFTILAPLGGGGMGVVFVAYDPNLDRKIALKVLRSRGEQGRREVLREGRALARLKHPNVVTVYEVGEIDEQVFVAMEYIEGENLREWLRAPRSTAAILARLVEAGRGLASAHTVGLVHRDFKPKSRRPSQTAPPPTNRPHSRKSGRFERVDVFRPAPRCPGVDQILAKPWQRQGPPEDRRGPPTRSSTCTRST